MCETHNPSVFECLVLGVYDLFGNAALLWRSVTAVVSFRLHLPLVPSVCTRFNNFLVKRKQKVDVFLRICSKVQRQTGDSVRLYLHSTRVYSAVTKERVYL
ncbi:hypothetical protein JOB18_034863 [Solea senegalensis]|uniref:Uncharacterized protein n=1 Tax=Solea senegalensis TaxID=28829 RepID=A0AAV6Q2M5_SOLSE|nr:hypothetical protein JOB18_034863 [Solea senegalensis]